MFLFLFSLSVAHASQHLVGLGDSIVKIKQYKHGHGKAFIHVHQNETTALKAARTVIKTEGGSVLTLVHSGGRNIVFYLQHQRYEFDPNRIFTDRGIKKSLLQFGKYTPAAQREVKKLANRINSLLPKGKIIAVHNNETYSLRNYFSGHDLAHDAQSIHVNKHHYYRNFFLVNKRHDYLRFKQMNFNSVWQSGHVTDDGSLSVFLGCVNYINVEAGYDQLATQIEMLRYA